MDSRPASTITFTMPTKLPLEIWHAIFGYIIDPKRDITIQNSHPTRDSHKPFLRATLRAGPAKSELFEKLAYHDILYPNSSRDFWHWLVPFANFHLTFFHDKTLGDLGCSEEKVDVLRMLQAKYDTEIRHITVWIVDRSWLDTSDKAHFEKIRQAVPPRMVEDTLKELWDSETLQVRLLIGSGLGLHDQVRPWDTFSSFVDLDVCSRDSWW